MRKLKEHFNQYRNINGIKFMSYTADPTAFKVMAWCFKKNKIKYRIITEHTGDKQMYVEETAYRLWIDRIRLDGTIDQEYPHINS